MQEYTTPGEVEVPESETLTTSLFENYETHPTRPALATRVGDTFQTISTKAFVDEVLEVAAGLMAIGVEEGDRVCVMSSTRYEWTVMDYAIWSAGGVTVPIYETSSAEQIDWILEDSRAKAIMLEDRGLEQRFLEVADRHESCQHSFIIEEGGMAELKGHGVDIDADAVRARSATRTGRDLATLVYTSGTTGRPKGVELTHTNFVWDATQVVSIMDFFRSGESTLLFLPLAHIFARLIQVGCVRTGVLLAYSTGIPNLLEELSILQPTFLLAVPRVFEKVFNGAQQRAHADGKGKIFDRAADVAIEHSRAAATGSIPLMIKLQHALFDKLVYGKMRQALGGRVEYAVSGGAALGERLGHFFHGVGITILEGYGLTETSAGATINQPDACKIGTVGKPLPGSSARIAEDGEVLLKTGGVMEGYWQNPEATREAINEDGWFHTGDLGTIDNEGYVSITGRKKEIIVTAGGKNVAPAPLEDRIRAHFLVSQAMVVGDDRKFVSSVVTIDGEAWEAWSQQQGKTGPIADHVEDEDLRREVQVAIDDANASVSKAESIRVFKILPHDFEVGEELSQKQSVKRHVVSKKYEDVIESIYS